MSKTYRRYSSCDAAIAVVVPTDEAVGVGVASVFTTTCSSFFFSEASLVVVVAAGACPSVSNLTNSCPTSTFVSSAASISVMVPLTGARISTPTWFQQVITSSSLHSLQHQPLNRLPSVMLSPIDGTFIV